MVHAHAVVFNAMTDEKESEAEAANSERTGSAVVAAAAAARFFARV